MSYKLKNLEPFGLLIEANSPEADILKIDVEELRDLFREHHLLSIRGFRSFSDAESFSSYCEKWGEISLWPFGKVLELVEHDNPEDHIFDSNYVPLHWDGMYRKQVPEYQIFHCVKAPTESSGGRTTFSNTRLALKNASSEEIALWEKVVAMYERKMEFYNSKTISPIVTRHPFRDYPVIRYNEPPNELNGNFLNPPIQKFSGIDSSLLSEFHGSLQRTLHDPKNFYAHQWHDGDVVVSDNFTLLHGREAFESKSARHLRRVHVLSDPPLDNPCLESYK